MKANYYIPEARKIYKAEIGQLVCPIEIIRETFTSKAFHNNREA